MHTGSYLSSGLIGQGVQSVRFENAQQRWYGDLVAAMYWFLIQVGLGDGCRGIRVGCLTTHSFPRKSRMIGVQAR